MKSVYFYTVILSFASGIFVCTFFEISWLAIVWVLFVVGVLSLWWCKNRKSARAPILFLLLLVTCSFVSGAARLLVANEANFGSALEDKVGEKVELKGVVVAEPEITAKTTKLVVEVDRERILVSTDRYAEVTYGDEISFTGKLKVPEAFETDFGRTFNYPGYLAVRKIFYTIAFATITVESEGNGHRLLNQLFKLKHYFLNSIESVIPEPEVGLGAGLLLGVKSSLGDTLEDAFRATGIIHIVVLSGTNIMLVVVFVMLILSIFFPVRPRVVAGVVAIVLFALLVGLSATVVRASIMACLVLLSLGLGLRYAITRALFFAGFIMLLFNPLLLVHDVGFQLSFLATLGLILVAPQFENLLTAAPARFKLKEYFIATIATQVMILPLLLYQIGQFSVVAVLVNMLVLPAVPVAMLLTFLAGIVGLISLPIGTVLGVMAYGSLKYIILVATSFAALPFATFTVPAFPFLFVPFMYAGIAYILFRMHKRSVTKVITEPDLSVWTVVEEVSLTALDGQRKEDEQSSPSSQTPPTSIFFR